jgi:PST family polysaccharide transporter
LCSEIPEPMSQDPRAFAHEIAAVFFRAGSSTVIGFVLRAVTMKIFAVTAGPGGIAIFGLIRQVIEVAILAATPGGGVAVVQAVSGASADKRAGIIRTAALLTLTGALVVATLLAFGGPGVLAPVAGEAAPVLEAEAPWIAFVTLLGIAATFCGAVVNGKGQYKQIVFAGAVGSFALLIFAYPVAKAAQTGDFFPFVLYTALPSIITIAMAMQALAPTGWLSPTNLGAWFERDTARQLYRLSFWLEIMGLASAGSGVAVRLLLLSTAGLAIVGAFTAAFQISMAFLGLLTAPLQMYHIPLLGAAKGAEEKRRILDDLLSFSSLLGAGAAVILIASKPLLIELLYSRDFAQSLAFLDWFFPTLYIQAVSSVYGSAILAAGWGRVSCGVELVRSGTFVALTAAALFLRDDPWLVAPAYLITRCLGLWLGARASHRIYGTPRFNPIGRTLLNLLPAAAVTVVAASALGKRDFDWPVAVLAGLALLLLAVTARPQERSAVASVLLRRSARSSPGGGTAR